MATELRVMDRLGGLHHHTGTNLSWKVGPGGQLTLLDGTETHCQFNTDCWSWVEQPPYATDYYFPIPVP